MEDMILFAGDGMLETVCAGAELKIYALSGVIACSSQNSDQRQEQRISPQRADISNSSLDSLNSASADLHDQFKLIDASGTLHVVQLLGWRAVLRTGHQIQIVGIEVNGSAECAYVLIHNYSLEDLNWNHAALLQSAGKCLKKHIAAGVALSAILAALTFHWSVFLLGSVITAVYFFVRRNILAQQLKQLIQSSFLTL